MTRPAIVIGLGGTGQWVLTYLKKDLLEANNGKMPLEVKLLCFDTTSNTSVSIGKETRIDENIGIGAVKLIKNVEFISLGGDVNQVVSEISVGMHPQLQWFPAKSFISRLDQSAFNLREGSYQLRQMGRISLFQDIAAGQNSQILSSVRAAALDLQPFISRESQIEVIIIGSLAGGTGAGMFVDLPYLIRDEIEMMIQNNYILRGFFLLPRALTSGVNRGLLARSFAAWRELDRFMSINSRFGSRKIKYGNPNHDLGKLSVRAYDVSYLIDPARSSANSLEATRPEFGVYPAITNAISMILDEKAGPKITENTINNINGILANLPSEPYYSVVGSYVIKIPVHYTEEKFAHQLSLDVLREFLKPEITNKNDVIDVSELNNTEEPYPNVADRIAVLNFLSSNEINFEDKNISNTRLMPFIAQIRKNDTLNDVSSYTQMARNVLSRPESMFFCALTDLSKEEEGMLLKGIINEFQIPIWNLAPPSMKFGDTPAKAFNRIEKIISEVRQGKYGLDTQDRFRGEYGDALETARRIQITVFKKLLTIWTLRTLNGNHHNPVIARGGKIGFVRAFYKELINTFSYFIRFIDELRLYRNKNNKLATITRESTDQAYNDYKRMKEKTTWITFWDNYTHPDAHQAQRNYLLAEQRNIDVRKDDILLDALAETVSTMLLIAQSTLSDIDSWIVHLATGDLSNNINGLYQEVITSLANVEIKHELDGQLNKISKLIGEQEYTANQNYISEFISHLKWKVEETEDSLNIICGVEMEGIDQNVQPSYIRFVRPKNNSGKENLETLLNLNRAPFRSLNKARRLAVEISNVYPTGNSLAMAVADLAEPMYTRSDGEMGPQAVSCYIGVQTDLNEHTTKYFREFEEKINMLNYEGAGIALVDTYDPFKMSIIRIDDLIPSQAFDMWRKCRDSYIQQVTDPSLNYPPSELYIFPAEINACNYESEMPVKLGKNYRILHSDVVTLLEDREKFEQFFLAYALGFIKTKEIDNKPIWILQLPRDKDPLYLVDPSTFRPHNLNSREDIFQIIYNFAIEGRDQRHNRNRPIDWKILQAAITNKQSELGNAKLRVLYQREISNPRGIVRRILSDVEKSRLQTLTKNWSKHTDQKLEDLADVIRLVFLNTIVELNVNDNVSIADFADKAGFRIKKTKITNIFELAAKSGIWGTRFTKPVLACQIIDQVIDKQSLLKLAEQIDKIYKNGKSYEDIVFVASDTPIPDNVKQSMIKIRYEKGFHFIPLEDVWGDSENPIIKKDSIKKLENQFQEILGPQRDLYNRKGPVSDKSNFFGREAIANDLTLRLQNGEAIGIFGLRKIGKTSLLQYIRSTSEAPMAHVDFLAGTDFESVIDRALKSWFESARDKKIVWEPDFDKSKEPLQQFRTAIERLQQSSLKENKGIPILLVDEIEMIFPYSDASVTTKKNYLDFSRILRGLNQENRLGLIFAGVDSTINNVNRVGREQNPFYQFLYEQYLGPISDKDCGEMVTAIGQLMNLTYTEGALEKIVQSSGCHPSIARQICSLAYRNLPKGKQKISSEHITKTLQKFISQASTSNFLNEQGLWGEVSNKLIWGPKLAKEFQRILLLLATKPILKEVDLLIDSKDRKISENAIEEMEKRGILKFYQDSYSIRFGVFSDWIKKYKLG